MFDEAISFIMVLPVRMVLRKEEFYLRFFLMYILMILVLLRQTLNMAAPLEDVQSIICLMRMTW